MGWVLRVGLDWVRLVGWVSSIMILVGLRFWLGFGLVLFVKSKRTQQVGRCSTAVLLHAYRVVPLWEGEGSLFE